MVQAGELRERVEVWKADLVTEDQETDSVYQPLRTIWANVTPSSGRTAELPGETERAEITHKLTIRPRSCRLTTATYFEYQGQRYDVQYWQPHYKRRDRLEIFCRLTQGEVQADGNG